MQNTYKGQSAAAILKTARIEEMRAGNVEIVVTLPGEGNIIAILGTRPDGWGGSVTDVLVLTDVNGMNVRLSTTKRSLARLEALHADCERQQRAVNERDGIRA
jgi:hypothetical protein